MVERLYASWLRAEQRSRAAAPGSAEAAERAAGADQLWQAYEQALARAVGHGSLKKSGERTVESPILEGGV
ncbi:MAG TPA: hypothetical protein VKR24_08785 [Candidatus Limnocylindrales bacterium]|nr:hypothetical protein [Candidatus Limnocylindrales bacterium]